MFGMLKFQVPEAEVIYLVKFFNDITYYRAMHFSAKRGIAIACRPSVRLSVWV